jgi:hypothetical protein
LVQRSLIGEVLARHPDREGRWPGENLLTDATAAVLRRAEPLACWLVAQLADVETPVDVEIDTEKRSDPNSPSNLDKVDLELAANGVLIWIEVKDWAREGHDQVARYLASLARRDAATKKLFYLSRLGTKPPQAAAKSLRWQTLGRQLEDGIARVRNELSPDSLWLVHDYLTYLKERGLASSDPLRTDLRDLTTRIDQARGALALLCEMVSEELEADWPLRDDWGRLRTSDGGPISCWPERWWGVHRATPKSSYPNCDFDWVLWGVRGQPAPARVATGLIWRGGFPNPLEDEGWVARMLALDPDDPFGKFESPDRYDNRRLYRSVTLERLAQKSSLNDQAELLSELVSRTFALLKQHPPSSHGDRDDR